MLVCTTNSFLRSSLWVYYYSGMNWAHCIHAQRVVEQHDDNTPGDAHVSVWAGSGGVCFH